MTRSTTSRLSAAEPSGDIARPEPSPVEAMSLRILGLVAVEGTVFTEQQLLDHLHGRTSPELQDLVIDALRGGFAHRATGTQTVSFAHLCIALGNFELLRRVVRSGPPQTRRFEKLGDSPAAWLDWLCSHSYQGSQLNGIAQSNGYDTVLKTLRPDSVKLLRLAYELEPTHRCLVQEAQGCIPVRDETSYPGNFHYALLHLALNGSTSTSQVHSQARKKEPFRMHDHGRGLEMHAAALECLAFLRSVDSVPWLSEKLPLDAMPFVTAFNLGSRYDDVRALMEAYRDMGLLDINECIHPARRTFGGDIPIDAAISAGASGAAAALIDMGCDISASKVAQRHGGDLIRMATELGRPETKAAVVQALMRRQLANSPRSELHADPAPVRRRLQAL
jgi:hypothetical protein